MPRAEDVIPFRTVMMLMAPAVMSRFPGTSIVNHEDKHIEVSIAGNMGSVKDMILEIYADRTFYISRSCTANAKNLRDVARTHKIAMEIVDIFQLVPSIVPKNK